MKILHVASEYYPLIKTGGLADVLGALPRTQSALGEAVRVVLPLYAQVREQLGERRLHTVAQLQSFAGQVWVRYVEFEGMGVYLVDAPQCFDRLGNPYHDEFYQDYADNYRRFALLGWIGAKLALGLDAWWGEMDVVHAHDWQAGLTLAYLWAWQARQRRVFTVHNLAYQGVFAAHHLSEIELPWSMFALEGLEFYGQMSYLKAGIYYSDWVTTVSPTYAQEITRQTYGCGLQGLLQTRALQGRLRGILNGIDEEVWNPTTDVWIEKPYSSARLQDKLMNKLALQAEFGLPEKKSMMVMVMIARLTEQKGADLLLAALDRVMALPLQLLVLGSGCEDLEARFLQAQARYEDKVGVRIGYDEALAHRLIAGGDVVLLPSRFEPCGLTQLYGLAYGTLPLVRGCGGLADTVVDVNEVTMAHKTATGFVFDEASAQAVVQTILRAQALWLQAKLWKNLQKQAMAARFTWLEVALEYQKIYQD